MKRKDIDAMREVRLWVGQILIPIFGFVLVLFPEAKTKIANKIIDLKNKITTKRA